MRLITLTDIANGNASIITTATVTLTVTDGSAKFSDSVEDFSTYVGQRITFIDASAVEASAYISSISGSDYLLVSTAYGAVRNMESVGAGFNAAGVASVVIDKIFMFDGIADSQTETAEAINTTFSVAGFNSVSIINAYGIDATLTINLLSPVLNNQNYTGTGAELVIDQPVDMGNVLNLAEYTTDTIVFDFEDNWGYVTRMQLRSIEFYLGDVLIPLTLSDFTSYATSSLNSTQKSDKVFTTGLSKTGVYSAVEWISLNAIINQRLIIKTNTEITFDKIIINNSHNSGTLTDRGVKDTMIYIKDDTTWTPSTVYGEYIPGSTKIFDGVLSQHPATDTIDDQPYAEIAWTSDQVQPNLKTYTAKSFVMDILDNFGASLIGVRSVEFLLNGKIIDIGATGDGFTAYATSELSANLAYMAFSKDRTKLGTRTTQAWTSNSIDNNQRLICVFDTPITFDTVRINNYIHNGTTLNNGSKTVVMRISSDTITDTTFGKYVTNETEIYNGDLSIHPDTDTIDDQDYCQVTDAGGMILEKDRDATTGWGLFDSIRGASILSTDSTAAEAASTLVPKLFPLTTSGAAGVGVSGNDYMLQAFGTTHKLKTVFSARSVIFDIADNHGDPEYMEVRNIEFLLNGVVVNTSGGVAYATSQRDVNYTPFSVFDLSTLKVGSPSSKWASLSGSVTNQRLIYVHHDATFYFDSIRINNGHLLDLQTDRGVKTVLIRIDDAEITDTTYSATADVNTIFVGDFPEHAAVDTIQDYVITFEEWHYNPESGFGFCKYHGTGFDGRILSHPMGQELQYSIEKALSTTGLWAVQSETHTGYDNYLALDTNIALTAISTMIKASDTTGITLGTSAVVNGAGEQYEHIGFYGGDLTESATPEFGKGVKKSWAIYTVPAGSGNHTFNTEVIDIHTIIIKDKNVAGSHYASSVADAFSSSVQLDDTAVEGAAVISDVTGSIVEIVKDASTDIMVLVIGSVAKTAAVEGRESVQTISLIRDSIKDWWDYFFSKSRIGGDFVFYFPTQIAGSQADLEISYPGGTAKCGLCLTGLAKEIYTTQYDLKIGISDYSKISTDGFGQTYLNQGRFAKRVQAGGYLQNTALDISYREVVKNRGVACVFDYNEYDSALGTGHTSLDQYQVLINYGFTEDFSITSQGQNVSTVNHESQGLT